MMPLPTFSPTGGVTIGLIYIPGIISWKKLETLTWYLRFHKNWHFGMLLFDYVLQNNIMRVVIDTLECVYSNAIPYLSTQPL